MGIFPLLEPHPHPPGGQAFLIKIFDVFEEFYMAHRITPLVAMAPGGLYVKHPLPITKGRLLNPDHLGHLVDGVVDLAQLLPPFRTPGPSVSGLIKLMI
jgi:hypothetical protein